MVTLEKAILRLALAVATLAASPSVFGQDAPVERPSVDRPALPQPNRAQAAPVEQPATAHPAPAQSSAPPRRERQDRQERYRRNKWSASDQTVDRHATFFYLAAGLGALDGNGGGPAFERTNPAVTGLLGVEVPLGGSTGLGFELNGDAELTGNGDRGSYTALLGRARLGQMIYPNVRLWGAVGIGRAGYLDGTLAGEFALGSTLLLVPKFGIDLSAALDFTGASDDDASRARAASRYDGGVVLLFAVKAVFELHKTR